MSSDPKRILIVRPSALGDVARTVPALVSLKRAYPQAKIDWLVNDNFVDAVAHHPDLHEAIPFPRRRLAKFGWSLRATREGWRYFRELKQRKYDAAYDLQGLWRSGWLTLMTRAAKRIGPADARELGWIGYNHRVRIDPSIQHTVDRMLAILTGAGIATHHDMRLYPPPESVDWARQWWKENDVDPGKTAIIAPTAKWESKRWPLDRFDALIPKLADHGLRNCIVVGAGSEHDYTQSLLDERTEPVRRLDMVGRTTVGQLMALIESSRLVIANDSAALHFAVGLGVRCVGFFGPTDPMRVGPYRYKSGVITCENGSRVHYRSTDSRSSGIGSISLKQAIEGVQRVLQSPPPGVS